MYYPILLIILGLLSVVSAYSQSAGEVTVRLSLDEGKTVYRAGETITLVLTFSSDNSDYSISSGQEVIDTVLDEVSVTPATGVFEWKKQYMRGAHYTSDAIHLRSLKDGPVRVELPLNHFVRFDAPGDYRVSVRTKRVWLKSRPAVELHTNSVAFEVKMMSESEEAAEVTRLSSELDKAKGWQEQTRIMTQMSYLAGRPAVAEKVKRFLMPVDSGNYHQAALYGLFISRDRREVIKLLEREFRDLEKPINFSLLGALSSLKLSDEVPVPVKPVQRTPFFLEDEPDALRIRDAYLNEIVESLHKRQGKNLREAAYLIMQNLPKKDPPAQVLARVRSILIQHFADLTAIGHESLLGDYHWPAMKDPLLVPALEKVLGQDSNPSWAKSVRWLVVRRLDELDPVRARPFLIVEIRDPELIPNDDIIQALSSRQLPEADDLLLQQIRRFGTGEVSNQHRVILRSRGMLLAKFATDAILGQVLDLYRENSSQWEGDSRMFVLSYVSRFDPKLALELLGVEIAKVDKANASMWLHGLTRVYYAPELTSFLEERLASDDAKVATSGAYILSKHGPPSSRAKIESRLDRWLAKWRGREAELDSSKDDNSEAMLQVELILALRNGKSWKASESQLTRMIADCKTKLCAQHFRPELRGN